VAAEFVEKLAKPLGGKGVVFLVESPARAIEQHVGSLVRSHLSGHWAGCAQKKCCRRKDYKPSMVE
jgi:hypothetical protein